jgi:glycerol-3-phosphate dehydrogenase (NAD(P)+)
MQIAFIGMGNFGKAIASLVEYNGLSYDFAEAGKLLDRPADLVFLMVPTQFMRKALEDNKPFISEQAIIVNAAKGIEEKTHMMAHQIVFSVGKYRNYYSLIGPSFAHEIHAEDPAVVSLGYKDPTYLADIKKTLETPYFRVETAKGFRALELASALKNLYAITCGYAQGMGFGANTQAQLITIALREFTILAKAMRFADYDPITPGVVGDLILTCTSKESRNFSYGYKLAKQGATDGKQSPLETVEGYHTSHSINVIAKEHNTVLPLAKFTSQIINGKASDPDALRRLLARY